MSNKIQVYFHEFNILMDNAVYLPLVSGILKTNALTDEKIRENYEFMPFLFIRKPIQEIIPAYDNPGIAAFSVSMWNANLSLALAKEVKERYPNCLIVFGGPNVPFDAKEFFEKHPFIDVTVRGEGEHTFNEILLRNLESRDFSNVAAISYRDPITKQCIKIEGEPEIVKDLDAYPCPYSSGAFDSLLPLGYDFQAIIETNRGCPFLCSFCFWGQGTMKMGKKYRHFGTDRVKNIAEWCGKNNIKYIFCADSNFGIFKRDVEIAQYFVDAKQKYGAPEKFRVCYGKNAEDTIYQVGKLLHSADMEKGITMSRQSNDKVVLLNIRRSNIKLSVYNSLSRKYDNDGIPVYTEFILGLPGETYETFLAGIDEIFECAVKTQVFVYFCQILNNTELSQPDYMKKFDMKTVTIPLTEVHGSIGKNKEVMETEEIVISNSSLTLDNWKKSAVLSWTIQLFHSCKLGFYLMLYMHEQCKVKYLDFIDFLASRKTKLDVKIINKVFDRFYVSLDEILAGNSYCRILDDCMPIYWTQEEAAYLDIADNKDEFYVELLDVIEEFLASKNISYNRQHLAEVVEYQRAIIPSYKPPSKTVIRFQYNVPEYFEKFLTEIIALKLDPNVLHIEAISYPDKVEFSKKVVLHGRKSNKMLNKVNIQKSSSNADHVSTTPLLEMAPDLSEIKDIGASLQR